MKRIKIAIGGVQKYRLIYYIYFSNGQSVCIGNFSLFFFLSLFFAQNNIIVMWIVTALFRHSYKSLLYIG